MNDDRIHAYRRALYRVFQPEGEFVMRVDVPCPELQRCHARHGVACSMFITAWNPGSVVQPDAINAAAQLRLRNALLAGGYPLIEGQGEDPDGTWTPEASFLALGVDKAEARQLCREFGQLAVIYADADAIPQLLTDRE